MAYKALQGKGFPRGEFKIIMGIDPGIANTGIAFVFYFMEDEKLLVPASLIATIKTHPKSVLGARLRHLYNKVFGFIHSNKPDRIVMERMGGRTNRSSAIASWEAIGVIRLASQEAGKMRSYETHSCTAFFTEYSAATIKKEIAGHGNAKKAAVKEAVRGMVDIVDNEGYANDLYWKSIDNHRADAIAIACTYIRKEMMQNDN